MRNIKSNRKERKFNFRHKLSSDFYQIRWLSLFTLLMTMMLEMKSTLSPYVLSTVPQQQQQWFSGNYKWSCERAYCWDCWPYTTPPLPVERLDEQWILGYWTEQVEGVCVCTCSTRSPRRAQSNSSMWFLRSKHWIDFVILATTENLLTARNKPGIQTCFPARVFTLIITTSTENVCNNDTAATQQYKITCTTKGGSLCRLQAAFYWTLKPKTFHIEVNMSPLTPLWSTISPKSH